MCFILQHVSFLFFYFGVRIMLESHFQRKLISELEERFPGALIFKNESKQGLPDLTILYGDRWALLECKRSADAEHQPNQDYYVNRANEMSFSRFIFPENKEEVLNELQQALRPRRKARVSKSE